jgi:hypothetical protein
VQYRAARFQRHERTDVEIFGELPVVGTVAAQYVYRKVSAERRNMEIATIIRPVGNDEENAYRKGMKHGVEKGMREMLLEIFHARGIELHAVERRYIAAESSPTRLRQWCRRAATASSAADVFGH